MKLKRKKMPKRISKAIFKRTAKKVHVKNLDNHIGRGGTTL